MRILAHKMTEPQDASPEPGASPSPYLRLPVPAITTILLAVLGALLAFGLYANANLRQQGIVVPTPVAAAALPTQTLAPTAVPVVQPTATTAAATPTPVAPIMATATSEATPIPTVVPPTATVTARPTIDPELETEIGDAYQTYWQVRAEALYDLDTTRLPEVMAGEHLTDAEDLIDQLRSEGHAVRTEVSHNYVVVEASDDTAVVNDTYVDNSVYVDPTTHADLSQPNGGTVTEQYKMTRINDTWKVVSLYRSSS